MSYEEIDIDAFYAEAKAQLERGQGMSTPELERNINMSYTDDEAEKLFAEAEEKIKHAANTDPCKDGCVFFPCCRFQTA